MRPRTLKISAIISGFKLPIATLKIEKFADVLEAETELVCPSCGQKPKWQGGYDCSCCPKCGKPMERQIIDDKGTVNWKCPTDGYQEPNHFNHWSQLKRILKDTGEEIIKPKLLTGEDVIADLYVMTQEEFGQKHADAGLTEYGVVVEDDTSAKNLKKLLIALTNLHWVSVIRYNDTYEERVALLTVSLSNRIILKELIPENIADIRETMRVDLSGITEKDIQEAESFVKQLPKAEDTLFEVHDYRTKGTEGKQVSPKVLELEAILKKATTPQTKQVSTP